MYLHENDANGGNTINSLMTVPPPAMPANGLELFAMLARQVTGRADPSGTMDVYPNSRFQNIGFFILFLFPALAIIVVSLRIYGRSTSKQFGWGQC